jgi:hypothetical protein
VERLEEELERIEALLGTPSENAVYPRKGGFQLLEHLAGGKTLIPEWVDKRPV